jgi:cysteine desulfurase
MLANNEIGAIQPIAEIGRVCKQRGVLFHCDATQAVGRIPIDVHALQVDLMSFSAHKLYGPKGVGALYVRRRAPIVRLEPRQFGGGQEHGLRSGTLNSPGIVGFGRAMEIAIAELDVERIRLSRMRNRLYDGLVAAIPDVLLNGPTLDDPAVRLAGNLNMAFSYVQGEALLLEIKDLAVSSGSACTSANPEPSHVLRALGLDDDLTKASLRFGLGRFNTEAEVDFAIEAVSEAVGRLRKLSSLT